MERCNLCFANPTVRNRAFPTPEFRRQCVESANFFTSTLLPLLSTDRMCFCRMCFNRATTVFTKIDQIRQAFEDAKSAISVDEEPGACTSAESGDEAYAKKIYVSMEIAPDVVEHVEIDNDIGMALMKNNEAHLVNAMWKNDTCRELMITKLTLESGKECGQLCSANKRPDSPFFINDVERLANFNLNTACDYFRTEAPISFRMLEAVTEKTRSGQRSHYELAKKRKERSVVLAAAVLLKSRNKDVSTFQLMLGLVLRHCGLNTRGVQILTSFNLTSSVRSLIEKRRPLAKKCDQLVQAWKSEVECKETIAGLLAAYRTDGFDLADSNLRADRIRQITGGDRENVADRTTAFINGAMSDCTTTAEYYDALCKIICNRSIGFGIVLDNIDLVGKAGGEHHIRHWTNVMAIREKPVNDELSMVPKLKASTDCNLKAAIPRSQLLPTIADMHRLFDSFVVFWQRIVVKNISAFKKFESSVRWHIPHQYEKEARVASEYELLGIVPNDESHTAEMVTIVEEIQARYLPTLNDGIITTTYFHGDQKTEKMAIVAQNARRNSPTPVERFEGISPVFALFHLQMNLLKMHCQDFVKRMSVSEKGTISQLAGLCGHTNAEKDPEKYYFEVYNIMEFYAQCGVVAATVSNLECSNLDEADACIKKLFPSESTDPVTSDDADLRTIEDKQAAAFRQLCTEWVQKILRPIDLQNVMAATNEDDDDCDLLEGPSLSHGNYAEDKDEDGARNYSSKWLFRSFMLIALNDAIREGDGDRIELMLKLFLPLLHKRRHQQYANSVLRLLTFTLGIASPAERDRVLSNMTTNWKGRHGHCTAVDWRLERANDFTKQTVKSLGANATTEAAVQISRSIKPLMQLQQSLEEQLGLDTDGGYRRHRYPEKDRVRLVQTFLTERLFAYVPNRPCLATFPFSTASVYEGVDIPKFWAWMQERLDADQRMRRTWNRSVL